ncbi:MAG: YkgJ family cysteine cluster protein [Promethearchaeota archaeon]
MVNDKFWEVVKEFNTLMKSAIEGPNCLKICNSDCCSIKIDVPKILAEEYIKQGYADKNDFVRSNVFSFKLKFDEKKGKCFLYNKEINGCLVHNSGIKPPQCFIYPTNFYIPNNEQVSCKKAEGWRIIDLQKTEEAKKILEYYLFLCQLEAKQEIKKIKERVVHSVSGNCLKHILKKTSPSRISGFKDGWDCFKPLSSEGISLQLKKVCVRYNKSCELIPHNFLDCISICDKVADALIKFLQQNLYHYVNKKGPDIDGQYIFNDLELNK